MKQNRLFQILLLLLQQRTINAKELSERFEVSIRTIYRDLDELTLAGIPVYTRQGNGGGIYLDESYRLSAMYMNKEEQESILVAMQMLSSLHLDLGNDSIQKLSALFPQSSSSPHMQIMLQDWSGKQKEKEFFPSIHEGLKKRLCLHFEYFSGREKKKRFAEPQTLFYRGSAWYLKAYCLDKDAIRIFKLNRMLDVKLSNQSCTHPISKEEPQFEDRESVSLSLQFHDQAEARIYDEFDYDMIEKNDQGFLVSTTFPISDWITTYLLSFGSLLTDIKPKYMKDRILQELNQMKQQLEIMYENN